MKNMWKSVKHVIMKADLLIIVLDARYVSETVNEEIIEKIRNQGKPYFFVVTKTDLAARIDRESIPGPYVMVSATEHQGKSRLRERILIMGAKHYGKDCSLRVGVLGYPNVGKSSVINMLKGRKSASTSIISGHTKTQKFIRSDRRILLIDTPGVIPYGERDIVKHVLIGSTDFDRVRNPVGALEGIMRMYPGVIEKYFGIDAPEGREDPSEKGREELESGSEKKNTKKGQGNEEAQQGEKENATGESGGQEREDSIEKTIEKIALKKNMLLKGGIPDVQRAARMAIMELQKGKIRLQNQGAAFA